jgi:hypothetical protein
MRTARQVIENELVHIGDPGRAVSLGLGFPPDRRIVIPGNHDRYFMRGPLRPFQVPNSLLERSFSGPASYPYVIGYRNAARREDVTVPALAFFVFDSTPSVRTFRIWKRTPTRLIACGHVHEAERRWLVKKSRALATKSFIPGLDGAPLPIRGDRLVRIVVVHHHPIAVNREGWFNPDTIMYHHAEFVEACVEARIDVVLFGHEHVSFEKTVEQADGHRTHFFCCPTATEFSGPVWGFYLFSFGERSLERETFLWNGGSFESNGVEPPYDYFG